MRSKAKQLMFAIIDPIGSEHVGTYSTPTKDRDAAQREADDAVPMFRDGCIAKLLEPDECKR